MNALDYVPIDADAKYGNTQLVRLGDTIAAAWWTGDMWAYRGTHEQLDFEPTHYAVLASRIDARRGETGTGSIGAADESLTLEEGDAQ